MNDERISAWLDGELSPDEAAAFERDVARDPGLADAVALFTGVRDDVVRHGPVRAPASFLDDVLDRIDEAEVVAPSTWWRRPFGVPVQVLAVAAAALLVLYAALPSGEPAAPHAGALVIPDDAPAASLAGSGAPIVVVAAAGYTLRTSLPESEVRALVDAVGATWRDGTPPQIRVAAVDLGPLRAQLRQLGALVPVGSERPVAGDVTFTLALTAP